MAQYRLDVVQTVAAAVSQTMATLGQGLRASIAWIASTLVVSFLMVGALDPSGDDPNAAMANLSGGQIFVFVLACLIVLTVVSAAAAAWHRTLLRQQRAPFFPPLDRRAFLYTGYSLLALVFAVAYAMVSGFVIGLFLGPAPGPGATSLGALVVAVTLGLVMGRFCLVFPAVALGERRLTLAQSWTQTRGNSWRVFLCFIAVGFLTWLPGKMLDSIQLAAPSLGLFVLLGTLLIAAISFLMTIALLSALYRQFMPDAATPARPSI